MRTIRATPAQSLTFGAVTGAEVPLLAAAVAAGAAIGWLVGCAVAGLVPAVGEDRLCRDIEAAGGVSTPEGRALIGEFREHERQWARSTGLMAALVALLLCVAALTPAGWPGACGWASGCLASAARIWVSLRVRSGISGQAPDRGPCAASVSGAQD